jgi:hypothetical protein
LGTQFYGGSVSNLDIGKRTLVSVSLRTIKTTMKKTLAVLATVVIAVGAFAQGKVVFGNANHPVTIINDGALLSAAGKSSTLAGLAAPQAGAANDVLGLLTAQLWAGTTAGNMSLVSTVPQAGIAGFNDGIFRNTPVTLPAGLAAGTEASFQIFLWEATAGSYTAAQTGSGLWYGSSAVFTATPGAIAGVPLANSAGWPNGPISLTANPVPEPSTFVLAGLGIASLLLFRRRK